MHDPGPPASVARERSHSRILDPGIWLSSVRPAATALLLLHSAIARADEGPARTFLSVGALVSLSAHVNGESPAFGYGAEASLMHRHRALDIGSATEGAFVQVQGANGFEHLRAAIGGQAGYQFVGLETGLSFEQRHGRRGDTVGLHLAPFLSIGVISVALRFDIPMATWNGDPYGVELGVVLTLKWPIGLDGSILSAISMH